MTTITDGKVVAFHHVLTDSSNVVLESTVGQQPTIYLHGAGNIIPRIEIALSGRSAGDTIDITLEPADAYGDRIEAGVVRFPRTHFPPDANLQAGNEYSARGPDGNAYPIWIVSDEGEEVVVDFNHPLAGERLHYELSVQSVRDATPDERDKGEPAE